MIGPQAYTRPYIRLMLLVAYLSLREACQADVQMKPDEAIESE